MTDLVRCSALRFRIWFCLSGPGSAADLRQRRYCQYWDYKGTVKGARRCPFGSFV